MEEVEEEVFEEKVLEESRMLELLIRLYRLTFLGFRLPIGSSNPSPPPVPLPHRPWGIRSRRNIPNILSTLVGWKTSNNRKKFSESALKRVSILLLKDSRDK